MVLSKSKGWTKSSLNALRREIAELEQRIAASPDSPEEAESVSHSLQHICLQIEYFRKLLSWASQQILDTELAVESRQIADKVHQRCINALVDLEQRKSASQKLEMYDKLGAITAKLDEMDRMKSRISGL